MGEAAVNEMNKLKGELAELKADYERLSRSRDQIKDAADQMMAQIQQLDQIRRNTACLAIWLLTRAPAGSAGAGRVRTPVNEMRQIMAEGWNIEPRPVDAEGNPFAEGTPPQVIEQNVANVFYTAVRQQAPQQPGPPQPHPGPGNGQPKRTPGGIIIP